MGKRARKPSYALRGFGGQAAPLLTTPVNHLDTAVSTGYIIKNGTPGDGIHELVDLSYLGNQEPKGAGL